MTSDQQLDLDAIETAARNAARIGSGIHPDTTIALVAEVRRLRAELAASRAAAFAEVADELEGIDFHPSAKATCTDLCRLLAGRFRRKGLAAIDAARTAPASA